MNVFEKQAMEFLRENEPVDAAMCYIDATEDYYSIGDLRSLTRVHLRLAIVAEDIGLMELAERSFCQAIVFAEKAAVQDDTQELLPLQIQYDLSCFLARQDRISDALCVIRQALEQSIEMFDEVRNRADTGFSDKVDTLFALIIFSMEAEELEDDLDAKQGLTIGKENA